MAFSLKRKVWMYILQNWNVNADAHLESLTLFPNKKYLKSYGRSI